MFTVLYCKIIVTSGEQPLELWKRVYLLEIRMWKKKTFILVEYKDALEQHVKGATETVEETIQAVCGASNTTLDAKLQELYRVLDSIGNSAV